MALSPGEDHEERLIASFEEQGAEQVRLSLMSSHVYSPGTQQLAARWLGQKDQERLDASEASSREQMELTRQANQIATRAKNAAIAALIVAIIGAIAAIVGDFR